MEDATRLDKPFLGADVCVQRSLLREFGRRYFDCVLCGLVTGSCIILRSSRKSRQSSGTLLNKCSHMKMLMLSCWQAQQRYSAGRGRWQGSFSACLDTDPSWMKLRLVHLQFPCPAPIEEDLKLDQKATRNRQAQHPFSCSPVRPKPTFVPFS